MKNLDIIPLEGTLNSGMAAKKKKKSTGEKRGTWTIDPPDDLRKKIELAIAATGSDRTSLLLECVREDLEGVVAKILEERRKAAEEFQKAHGAASKKTGTDAKAP